MVANSRKYTAMKFARAHWQMTRFRCRHTGWGSEGGGGALMLRIVHSGVGWTKKGYKRSVCAIYAITRHARAKDIKNWNFSTCVSVRVIRLSRLYKYKFFSRKYAFLCVLCGVNLLTACVCVCVYNAIDYILYFIRFIFLAQIQLYGFNKELYHNMSEAQHKSQGIVGISLMVQIGETPNPELRIITSSFNKVLYRGKNDWFSFHLHIQIDKMYLALERRIYMLLHASLYLPRIFFFNYGNFIEINMKRNNKLFCFTNLINLTRMKNVCPWVTTEYMKFWTMSWANIRWCNVSIDIWVFTLIFNFKSISYLCMHTMHFTQFVYARILLHKQWIVVPMLRISKRAKS